MAIARPPGVTGRLSTPGYFPYDIQWYGTNRLVGVNDYWPREASYRGGYAKGDVIDIDGKTFRMPTPYDIRGWRIVSATSCEIEGYSYFLPEEWARCKGNEQLDIGYFADLVSDQYLLGTDVGQRNEAATKALNEIADQKVDLGENLGTVKQTYRMFASKAKLLADALHSGVRNKSLIPFLGKSYDDLLKAGVGKTIAGTYLEYVYGLKPLMQDIYEIGQMFKEQTNQPLLMRAKGKGVRSAQAGPGREFVSSFATASVESMKCTSTCRVNIWATVSKEAAGLRALNQLGLLNPLSLAWNLTPWSFCVDWFLPIGQVITALTAPAGLRFISGTVSWKIEQSSSYSYVTNMAGINPGIPIRTKFTPGSFTLEQELYERVPLTSWPLPGLWVDPDPLRADRSIKGLALTVNSLASKRSNYKI